MKRKSAVRRTSDRRPSARQAGGQLLIRKIDAPLKRKLRIRAERQRQSMEEVARDILRDALKHEDALGKGLGTRIAERFRGLGFQEGEIQELRGYSIEPVKFEE